MERQRQALAKLAQKFHHSSSTGGSLYLSARDPATAQAFIPLIDALQSAKIPLCLLAQEPAAGIWHAQGLSLMATWPEDAWPRLNTLESLAAKQPPLLVVTGVSSPGVGIDEALIHWASLNNLPLLAIQTAWGGLNTHAPALPPEVLVVDELSVQLLNKAYPQIQAQAIGSLRHVNFAAEVNFTAPGLVKNIGQNAQNRLVFLGQPLDFLSGYSQTFSDLLWALAPFPQLHLVYRPHPKESASGIARFVQWMDEQLPNRYTLHQGSFVDALLGAEVVVSLFSSGAFDNLCLNEMSPQPLSTTVYAFYQPDVVQWYRQTSHLEVLPLVEEGLALQVTQKTDFVQVLQQALDAKLREQLWQRAQNALPPQHNALASVCEIMAARMTL